MESEIMPKARRVTVTLSEDVAGAADEAAAERGCSRSALIEDALRWYLRVRELPWEEASPEEIEAIEKGRAEHARGEFATFEEIKRDLEADLLAKRPKKSAKASASRPTLDGVFREMARDPLSDDVVVLKAYAGAPPIRPHPASRLKLGEVRWQGAGNHPKGPRPKSRSSP